MSKLTLSSVNVPEATVKSRFRSFDSDLLGSTTAISTVNSRNAHEKVISSAGSSCVDRVIE